MESGKRLKKRRTAILKRETVRLERELFRLETHLGTLYGSEISGGYSRQHTASYVEDLIQQKRKEIIDLENISKNISNEK